MQYVALFPAYIVQAGAAAGEGVGSASGSCTVSAVGASVASSTASASGSGVASGVGASVHAAAGSSSGSSGASGVGVTAFYGTGSADGSCTASGVGISTAEAAGASSGASTVSGISDSGSATGAASGVSTVSGAGASAASAEGIASGTATCEATSASLFEAQGISSGSSTALAVGDGGATPSQSPARGGDGGKRKRGPKLVKVESEARKAREYAEQQRKFSEKLESLYEGIVNPEETPEDVEAAPLGADVPSGYAGKDTPLPFMVDLSGLEAPLNLSRSLLREAKARMAEEEAAAILLLFS